MASTMEQVHQTADAFSTKRVITVIVGQGDSPHSKTCFVQEALLSGISDFFAKALSHNDWGGSEGDELKLLDDNIKAFEMLLYWRLTGQVLSEGKDEPKELEQLWVHCYILGDKYGIERFQDLAMLELLITAHAEDGLLDLQTIKLGIAGSGPTSRIRVFLAEELARGLKMGKFRVDDLDEFDGMEGVTKDVVKAHINEGDVAWKNSAHNWRKYLAGNGLTTHWLHKIHGSEDPGAKTDNNCSGEGGSDSDDSSDSDDGEDSDDTENADENDS